MQSLRFVALALILIWPASAVQADPAADARAELRRIKLELWPRAYREQDTALLDRLLDDSFRMVDGQGRISTKAEELAWIADHAPGYDSFRYEIERLDVYDGHTAIIAGQGTVKGVRDGQPWVQRYRSSNVLIQRDGRWRAIASQVTMLPER